MEISSSQVAENKPSTSSTQTTPKQTENSSTSSSDEYFVQGITADILEKFWPLAEPYIKRALDKANGELDHHDIKVFCQERDMQLWMVANKSRIVGAATTEIVIYPRKKIIRVVTLAGNNYPEWFPVIERVVEAYGMAHGCEGCEVLVRPGFTKKLAPHKFRKVYEMCFRQFY